MHNWYLEQKKNHLWIFHHHEKHTVEIYPNHNVWTIYTEGTTREKKKRKLEQLKQQDNNVSDNESDLDDFIGPVLISKSETTIPATSSKPSLLELHQQKTQDSEVTTQYDPTKALHDEVKEELLRKLQANGGLSGRFTSSK